MDPLSFTASIFTVTGVVLASSKIIHDIRHKVKRVPEHVDDLFKQIETLEGILKALKEQFQHLPISVTSQGSISTTYKQCIDQMQEEVKKLHTVLCKMEPLLLKKTSAAKLSLRIHGILNERQIADYQKKISIHCGILVNLQSIINW